MRQTSLIVLGLSTLVLVVLPAASSRRAPSKDDNGVRGLQSKIEKISNILQKEPLDKDELGEDYDYETAQQDVKETVSRLQDANTMLGKAGSKFSAEKVAELDSDLDEVIKYLTSDDADSKAKSRVRRSFWRRLKRIIHAIRRIVDKIDEAIQRFGK